MGRLGANAKRLRKRDIGPVAARLIPTLHSSTDGAGDDGQVQCLWDAPLVQDFIS